MSLEKCADLPKCNVYLCRMVRTAAGKYVLTLVIDYQKVLD